MAIPSSQLNEILHKLRPAMHVNLFKAAIHGNRNVLMQRLGLPPEAPNEIQVQIEPIDPDLQRTEAEHETVEFKLGSATRFGDTLLHLLVTKMHNELARMVFSKDMTLLKACNNNLETPLHCAAKVGNEEVIRHLIRMARGVVRDALGETNENGDTALHIAANHNHGSVVAELMKLDPDATYKENKQGFSPFYIAIVQGHTSLAKTMLQVGAGVACTQFSNGMFPVHVAARMGNIDLVMHFLQEYCDDAELLDPCGRNLFHIAAEQNNEQVFSTLFNEASVITTSDELISKMVARMINERDYEGNTPLHIAAIRGQRSVMRTIWLNTKEKSKKAVQNNQGLTPFDISVNQVKENATKVCLID